jgi:hypothetical protein
VESVRDFVLLIERSLGARRLYPPGSQPYRDANQRAFEKARAMAGTAGFTLHFGQADIIFGDHSVVSRPKPEDAFFFPLYRDGLRALTFTPEMTLDEMAGLLSVFELKDQNLGPADDTVNYLWRSDLKGISHVAVDGIGDVEDDGSAKEDFRSVVVDLVEKIRKPAAPQISAEKASGQSVHDAATRMRMAIEENPAVLRLTQEQLAELWMELAATANESVVERFIEILLVIVRLPFRSIDPAKIGPILGQLVEGFWTAREYDRLIVLLTHIDVASVEAPSPRARQAMAEVVNRFLTDDRLVSIMKEAEQKTIALPLFSRLWDLLPDARAWPLMMDAWVKVADHDLRGALQSRMRKRLGQNPDLLAATFAESDPARVRAALTLFDEKTEAAFAGQLMALATHPDESLRLKGLNAASKSGGTEALEVLWKAMESDPSKSVRLFAFRSIAASKHPELASRLGILVTSEKFNERPVWEREKYVRLLGTIAGPAAEPLFESWIPDNKWRWSAKDVETLELALRGLAACGDRGYERVRTMGAGAGRGAEIARKVLDSISRAAISQETSFMRPVPVTGEK